MPRIPRLFGRKRGDEGALAPAGDQQLPDTAPRAREQDDDLDDVAPLDPLIGSKLDLDEEQEDPDTEPEPVVSQAPPVMLPEPEEEPTRSSLLGRKHLDLVHTSNAPIEAAAPEDPVAAEPETVVAPAGKTLIGGKEEDLVPLIPDTEADVAGSGDLDETGLAEAAVESLKSASELLVARVNKLRGQESAPIISGLITLIGELDTRYAHDMGIMRRNGLEDVLLDVRGTMAEGDRFVLESLENGRGGLTADPFLRDLRTIAPGDRPRLLGHYVTFLCFMIQRVLHQYLRPLEEDETRTYEISYRLDYLIEGVRDMLLARVTSRPA